jgi:hypothetical protein
MKGAAAIAARTVPPISVHGAVIRIPVAPAIGL